jgi:FlaA1/EpsC-like NDP-sugar epimerase
MDDIYSNISWIYAEPSPKFLDFNVLALFREKPLESAGYFSFISNNILDEIIAILLIISSVFIAFSKEKEEDEYISLIRLESLVWATYLNYAILILTIVFVYELSFLWVFIFNMFTILFFFIIKFNWAIYKMKEVLRNEK